MTSERWFYALDWRWMLTSTLALTLVLLLTLTRVGMAQTVATTNCMPNGSVFECTVTFTFNGLSDTFNSGSPQNWTVPAGVTQATFDLYGAQGDNGGGWGGRIRQL